jgi:hypothetical protein
VQPLPGTGHVKMIFPLSCSVPFDTKYETVLNALEDAKSHALSGGDCAIYKW